jgi:1,4-alpha-glucan branching enzyme
MRAVCLLLHAHLPWVRHAEHEGVLEEGWFFEALMNCYLPLLDVLESVAADRVPARVTVSISSTLSAMLDDSLLMGRARRHVDALRRLVDQLRHGSQSPPPTLDFLQREAVRLERVSVELGRSSDPTVLERLRALDQSGAIELIATAASHAYLPLLATEAGRRAQIRLGLQAFERAFGRRSRGFWLPECGYAPGLDGLLAEHSLRFTFVEEHALSGSSGLAPVGRMPSGVLALARDAASAREVWSREVGYPGDPVYREFHRDVGFDLPTSRLPPQLGGDGPRRSTGLKLHRIGHEADLRHKEPYESASARHRAREHAHDFLRRRQIQLERAVDRPQGDLPVICPFDAELFGHWWFEGPVFLDALLRGSAEMGPCVPLRSVSEVVESLHDPPSLEPQSSSWGEGGDHRTWLNPRNHWLWPALHRSERHFLRLAQRACTAELPEPSLLGSAARELLLAQASDWLFQIANDPVAGYPVRRARDHLSRFAELVEAIESRRSADPGVVSVGAAPWPWLDPAIFR